MDNLKKNTYYLIKHKNRIYEIEKQRMKSFLGYITQKDVSSENFYKIIKIFKKYHLYDNIFLQSICEKYYQVR